jgi:hypothetical protein
MQPLRYGIGKPKSASAPQHELDTTPKREPQPITSPISASFAARARSILPRQPFFQMA